MTDIIKDAILDYIVEAARKLGLHAHIEHAERNSILTWQFFPRVFVKSADEYSFFFYVVDGFLSIYGNKDVGPLRTNKSLDDPKLLEFIDGYLSNLRWVSDG